MIFNNITNPLTKKTYSIFSKEGKNLLKRYKKLYKSGGHYCPCVLNKKTGRCIKNKKKNKEPEVVEAAAVPLETARQRMIREREERRLNALSRFAVSEESVVPSIDYQGMWYPQTKSLSKMNRKELIRRLRGFRDAWEEITMKNMDLSDERLATETTPALRELLKDYFTEDSRQFALHYLHLS